MKRISWKMGKISLGIFVLLIAIGCMIPTWTPRINGEQSISSTRQIVVNGSKHEVMIRGQNRHNPIVIFVHGGPGCSEIPYVRKYQDLLEQQYTIVHYDQRGSGKSYHFFEDYSKLSSDVLVDDLIALTDYVTKSFGQEKVLLIGHSYGTYIGMKAAAKAPEKFIAYIGIGQVANHTQSEIDSLNYATDQAMLQGNSKDMERLAQLRNAVESGEETTPRDLIRKYGGAARLINENNDYIKGFLWEPEYNLLDVIRYFRGVSVSQKLLLKEEREHDLTSIVSKVDIPVYMVMGKYDYMTSVHAARDYFDKLEAPSKEFVVFDKSAHYPQFEEKERFAEWLKGVWDR